MSDLLIGAAVAAALSTGCGLMTGRQRGRLSKIQAIRSVTIDELQELQQGVASEIGAGSYVEAVKLQADLICDQTLIAPFSEEICIAYRNKIVEIYEERVTTTNSEGKSTTSWQRNERSLSSEERRCPFALQQGNQLIPVDPEGAEVDFVEILNRMEPPGQLNLNANNAGLEGAAAVALQLGSALMATNVNSRQGQSYRLIGYRRVESIFPASGSVFVVAEASDSGGSLVLSQPKQGGLFLIRREGEERLLKRLQNSIRIWAIGFSSLAVITLICLIVALLGH
ncbi:MAG: GIDE domain-containing protein [Cyanobacteria bacterium]|nr:GIDE domain-containing protein [Cyanobacteriota bacterium]